MLTHERVNLRIYKHSKRNETRTLKELVPGIKK